MNDKIRQEQPEQRCLAAAVARSWRDGAGFRAG